MERPDSILTSEWKCYRVNYGLELARRFAIAGERTGSTDRHRVS